MVLPGFGGATPSVSGKTVAEVRALLEGLRLSKLKLKRYAGDDCAPGTVCGSSPKEGEQAFVASTQILYVGAGTDGLAATGPAAKPDTEPTDDAVSLDDEPVPDDYEPLFGDDDGRE